MTKAYGGQQCNNQLTKGSAKAGGGGGRDNNSNGISDDGINGGSGGGEDNDEDSDGDDNGGDNWQLFFLPLLTTVGPFSRGNNCTCRTFVQHGDDSIIALGMGGTNAKGPLRQSGPRKPFR